MKTYLALLFLFVSVFPKLLSQVQNLSGLDSFSLFNVQSPKIAIPLFKFDQPKGQIFLESKYSNVQNPILLTDPTYFRSYGNATVFLLGLPFQTSYFYTTERFNGSNSNFVNFQFDPQALKNDLLKKGSQQVSALQHILLKNKQIIATLETAYQSEINDLQHYKDSLNTLYSLNYFQSHDTILKNKNWIFNNYDTLFNKSLLSDTQLPNYYQPFFIDSLPHISSEISDSFIKKDSLNFKDSIINNSNLFIPIYQRKILDQQIKIQKIDSLRQHYKSIYSKDSLKITEYYKIIKSGKTLSPKLKWLNHFDQFSIGLISPDISELTIKGIPMKGVDVTVSNNIGFIRLTGGKSKKSISLFNQETNNQYNRNVYSLVTGIGKQQANHLSFGFALFNDQPHSNEFSFYHTEGNQLYSVQGQWSTKSFFNPTKIKWSNLVKWDIILSFESALSKYTRGRNKEVTQIRIDSMVYYQSLNESLNLSHLGKATIINHSKGFQLEAKAKKISPEYKSLGNPFLRNNQQELDVNWKQAWFKNSIRTTFSFKQLHQLAGYTTFDSAEAKTNTQGYGIKIQTFFKKFPRITFGYNPYHQGNNHPDIVFRTNNQYAITYLHIFHMLRNTRWNTTSTISVNHSKTAFEFYGTGKKLISISNYGINQTLEIYRLGNLSLNYNANRNNEGVDTMNSDALNITFSFTAFQKISVQIISEFMGYKFGGKRYYTGFCFAAPIKKIHQIKWKTQIGRIQRLWGEENQNTFESTLIWSVRL